MQIKRPSPQQELSKDAVKVFSGIIYDVYQWEQELFDGSKATWERLRRKQDSVVILGATTEGEILILEEQQSGTSTYLTLPAGQIEEGEDPLVGAQREFVEETGYRAAEWELLSSVQIDGRTDWAVYTFIARGCKKVGEQQLDPGEKIKVMTVSFEEFLKIAVTAEFRVFHILKDLLAAMLSPEAKAAFKKRLGIN